MRLSHLLLLSMFLLLVTACTHEDRSGEAVTQLLVPLDQTEDEPAVTATVLGIPEVEALIASQRGSVVVADLWALW